MLYFSFAYWKKPDSATTYMEDSQNGILEGSWGAFQKSELASRTMAGPVILTTK